jgi:hypothetical protein
MSKKDDKDKKVEPPIDYQVESKMQQYTITLKDLEINDLKKHKFDLKDVILNLEKENADLKSSYIQSFKNEKTIRQMQEMLDHQEKESQALRDELRAKSRDWDEERDALVRKYEGDINRLKSLMDSYQKKIDSVNNIQNVCEKQEETIKNLELEKDKIRIEADERIKNKEIRNQIKFSDLKKKMMENIQETQKNVTQLNIEYMDVSTKLTLLQNHQLLIELEYQSQQIEELLKKKENLEKKVFELNRDIEVHKEVELALAEKNKKLTEHMRNMEKQKVLEEENIGLDQSSINKIYINNNVKEFTMINNLEKKILTLDSQLKKKQSIIEKMKNKFDMIEEKLKNYEKKYSNIFELFDEGLKRLSEELEIKGNNDINVNLENIRNAKFDSLSSSEKYSVLIILMKHLTMLINPNDLKFSELTNQIENVKIKYQTNSKKYLEDPLLKKVFATNKNTMVQSIKRSMESLPQINMNNSLTKGGGATKIGEYSKIMSSRYQAVI